MRTVSLVIVATVLGLCFVVWKASGDHAASSAAVLCARGVELGCGGPAVGTCAAEAPVEPAPQDGSRDDRLLRCGDAAQTCTELAECVVLDGANAPASPGPRWAVLSRTIEAAPATPHVLTTCTAYATSGDYLHGTWSGCADGVTRSLRCDTASGDLLCHCIAADARAWTFATDAAPLDDEAAARSLAIMRCEGGFNG